MREALQFVESHAVFSQWLITAIVTAAISSMPTPKPTSGAFYVWLYSFTHAVLGMIGRVAAGVKGASGEESKP